MKNFTMKNQGENFTMKNQGKKHLEQMLLHAGCRMEEHWAGAWQDVNETLCVVHESEEAKEAWYGKVQEGEGARHKEGQPRTVFSFLKFTQKTIDLCPPSCTCMIAKGRVKFAGTRSLEVQ